MINNNLPEYMNLDEEIYTNIYDNPIGKVLHKRRFDDLYNLVNKYGKDKKVIDICCGFCEWNEDKLDIIGFDLNKNALEIAKSEKRISHGIIGDAMDIKLENNSFDIIVNSQALEHIQDPEKILKDFWRILDKDGILIIAVPYDTFFSLWRPLFFARYLWGGLIKGNEYYKNKGGHIHHYSPESLSKQLEENNFEVLEIVNNLRFTMTIVARRIESERLSSYANNKSEAKK